MSSKGSWKTEPYKTYNCIFFNLSINAVRCSCGLRMHNTEKEMHKTQSPLPHNHGCKVKAVTVVSYK